MSSTAVVVDYGSGNLHSAGKALERAARDGGSGVRVVVSSDPDAVMAADRIVLPGVGAFGDCHAGLAAVAGLEDAIKRQVIENGRPFLGICVGMQLMATRGLEFGEHPGLDWIAGEVRPIAPADPGLKIPHMGWNTLTPAGEGAAHPLFADIPLGADGWHAYFVHSFHFVPQDERHVFARTDYGGPITAAVGRDNLFGTQFHPEKSQALGLKLLANFLAWSP